MSDTIESTVMAEPEASSSSAILTGMKRGFPIFLGYVPLGFAYGVLAVQNNIPAVYAVLFSLLVYAGAGSSSPSAYGGWVRPSFPSFSRRS